MCTCLGLEMRESSAAVMSDRTAADEVMRAVHVACVYGAARGTDSWIKTPIVPCPRGAEPERGVKPTSDEAYI